MKLYSVAFKTKVGVHALVEAPGEFILADSFEAAYNKAKELGGDSLEVQGMKLELGGGIIFAGSYTETATVSNNEGEASNG